MHVLVVEDDPLLLEFIERCLKKHDYRVESATDGRTGYQKAMDGAFDAIILDVNLPYMKGTEVCRKLREEENSTPILFLSANNSIEDKLLGFKLGADDYLTKPFSYEELIARIEAVLRRPTTIVNSKIEYGDLIIDRSKRVVHKGEVKILLTPKEFRLLETLVRNSETVLSKEHLLKEVWGVTVGNTSNRLEVTVRNLREKLDKPFGTNLINTEYGVGYILAEKSRVFNNSLKETSYTPDS